MAVFVDLDDEDVDLPLPLAQPGHNGIKPIWPAGPPLPSDPPVPVAVAKEEHAHDASKVGLAGNGVSVEATDRDEAAHEPTVLEQHNSVAVALGCYPIVMAVAAQLDLNDLDSLSRTCRGVHDSLLQYRTILLKSTLHCTNDELPVDPESTLRYRARAGNWYYMEDTARSAHYNGKAGSCARDKVAECRKCGTVVCRNCAIKPPANAVLRDRHRRVCMPCQKSPIGSLVKPAQSLDTALSSDSMQRAICSCASAAGVWLCQPCGRGIRASDSEYRSIWIWRRQYVEALGGLGTGIGDADRGVECARKENCCNGKYIEHETDSDAADAREAEDLAAAGTPTSSLYNGSHSWSSSHSSLHGYHNSNNTPTPSGLLDPGTSAAGTRTPSPALPGYARHEVEGIGNKIKMVRLSMVRVGGCVPEWKDEKASGQAMRREMEGEVRSWCGWCDRVIPSKKDYEVVGKIPASAPTSTTA